MTKYKVVLFDADGVIVTPKKKFSHQFAEKYGIDPEHFQEFFKGDFTKAIIGQADLKEVILKYNHIWKWNNDPQELLDMWFESENVINAKLLELIEELKIIGVHVCLATHQEKYRAKYMREVMFPGVFDNYFISSEIGATKTTAAYWDFVLTQLKKDIPDIKPSEILFFDDTQQNIDAANKAGIKGIYYNDIEQVKTVLTFDMSLYNNVILS